MTREDAIKRLKEYAQYSYGIWHNDEEDTKAFDMAIEALQTDEVVIIQTGQTHGKSAYIKELAEVVRCKDCRHMVTTSDGEYNPEDIVCDYWATDGLGETDFCSYGERKEE